MKHADKDFSFFTPDTSLHLPYAVIDIKSASDEHFVFSFLGFDEGQTVYSVKNNGIAGKFGIEYHGHGISCSFPVDVTVGCVRDFGVCIENEYDGMGNGTVDLRNYEAPERASLTFTFDKQGHIRADGKFMNKDTGYSSGIVFSFDIDSCYIPDIIKAGDGLFKELYRLQGHNIYF